MLKFYPIALRQYLRSLPISVCSLWRAKFSPDFRNVYLAFLSIFVCRACAFEQQVFLVTTSECFLHRFWRKVLLRAVTSFYVKHYFSNRFKPVKSWNWFIPAEFECHSLPKFDFLAFQVIFLFKLQKVLALNWIEMISADFFLRRNWLLNHFLNVCVFSAIIGAMLFFRVFNYDCACTFLTRTYVGRELNRAFNFSHILYNKKKSYIVKKVKS